MCIPCVEMMAQSYGAWRAPKPRIVRADGRWLCGLSDAANPRPYRSVVCLMQPVGAGATPAEAFENWQMRLNWNAAERRA